ncbi:MAG: pyridoxamine 5'-phosphate oxidase family protein [Acidobacteriota bacterium]
MEPREITAHTPRRRDRAQNDPAWIERFLAEAPLGVLATSDAEGPSLNPNLFVYDPETRSIFLHTAHQGRTRDAVKEQPCVAFSAAHMGRLLPAESAVNFSVEYASVIVYGRASIVEERGPAKRALDLFMRKYAPQFEPGVDYRDTSDRDLARTSVLRIDVESWSGKCKEESSQSAGAYGYRPSDRPSADGRAGSR